MNKTNNPEKLIENALRQYGITTYSSRFIRHNDNLTLKIDNEDDNSYVLRIHSPITSGLQGVQHTFEGLNAEMELLNSLNKQTSLHLQQAIKNQNGQLVSTIVDVDHNFIPLATLLTWEEGVVYTGTEINSEKIAYEVGVVLAKLHNFSNNWSIPQPFIRPNYDIEKYRNLTDRLQYGVEINLFTSKQYDVVLDTMKYIKIIFDRTPKFSANWGIVHADLQGGNIIVNNDTVIPIDFGFSGYGYYLFDIGITLTSFNINHRKKVLEGYKALRNLSEEDELLISAGFILAIFGGFGFMVNNQKAHQWIERRMPYVTEKYCRALLDKKSFLLDIE
ncbi:phosphotransferase enzyme family protein [Bacillus sp. es.036]|uniref:phosphotransferase enzyme family protein n=1 Tax=Bacillus sp. es.036 TaxID=1761764 RepID=UPI000BF8946E|nr:phosphotransferase [Bacillus sp. es.036]PFG12224.1 Ser/Thr protein kinase RdoA (MazF antagonist) [Bacillus sp. es.036]